MTNALFDDDAEDHAHVVNIAGVAARRGGTYIPVRLVISDVEEHVRRITAENRAARKKETNPEAPARYVNRTVLVPTVPHVLTLDVTQIPAADAAQKIIAHAKAVRQRG